VSYGWRRQDGVVVEICDECGFDGRRTADPAVGLRAVLSAMEALLRDPDVDRRPAAEIWSAAEYVTHSIDVVQEVIAEVADAAGVQVPTIAVDATTAIVAVDELVELLVDTDLDSLSLEMSFATLTGTDNLLHALHDLEHHLLDIRRGYAAFALARGDALHTTVR
jgi:hypothetical protein